MRESFSACPVRQAADAFNGHGHFVAGHNGVHARWRADQYHVTGIRVLAWLMCDSAGTL
jgi:hypothetical protein